MMEIDGFKGKILEEEPMARHTTWKVGGPARFLVIPADEKDVERAVRFAVRNSIGYCVIGNGSNVYAGDEGVDGMVIKLSGSLKTVCRIRFDADDVLVCAGAGITMAEMSSFMTEMELSGFEFLAGVPATVGGAVRMNAGAWGQETSGMVEWLNLLGPDGVMRTVSRDELKFGYRALALREGEIVLSAVLRMRKSARENVRERIQENIEKRKEKQPLDMPSCGSVFKNPGGGYAARLIEEAGLKGTSVGGALVSPKHANFIVNTGSATAQDMEALMAAVKEKVFASTGVMLEQEVIRLGGWKKTAGAS